MKVKILTFSIVFTVLTIIQLNAQVEKFQAAYIFNFTRFVEWPADYLTGNFIIGVLGNDPVVKEIQDLASTKTIYGRKIDVKVFSNPSSISSCHILFVPENQSSKISDAKSKIQSQSVLLISYSSGGISSGSGINFVLSGSKLQFEIKKSNIIDQGLKVNTDLENLAMKKY